MCLLAIHFQVSDAAPLLIAANREEFYDRPSAGPTIQPGPPRVLCGVDLRAGGTWLGVNEHGVVAAVTNRAKPQPGPAAPPRLPPAAGPTLRSRGLLCRDLLDFDDARAAAQFAREQLGTGAYDGANFVCLDARYAAVIHAGPQVETVELPPGLHLLTAGDINDAADQRQALAQRLFAEHSWTSLGEFAEAAKRVCSRGPQGNQPGIVLRGDGRGTVSSTILVVTRRAEEAIYQYAAGPPDTTPYREYSDELRSMLS